MTLLSIYAEKKVCIRSANGNDHLVIAIVSGVPFNTYNTLYLYLYLYNTIIVDTLRTLYLLFLV